MRNWRLQWSILSRSLYSWLFFILKEVAFCFIMSTNFCVWPEGLILLAHCLLFFHWALIYPEEWSMCTHIESIWAKTNSAWKRQCGWRWQQSSLLFPLLLSLIWPSNTRSEIVSSSVIFFSFFLFSHFSKTLRWKTYVAYFKSGRKRRRWTHSLWQLQGVFELYFEYLQSFSFFWSSRFFRLCI